MGGRRSKALLGLLPLFSHLDTFPHSFRVPGPNSHVWGGWSPRITPSSSQTPAGSTTSSSVSINLHRTQRSTAPNLFKPVNQQPHEEMRCVGRGPQQRSFCPRGPGAGAAVHGSAVVPTGESCKNAKNRASWVFLAALLGSADSLNRRPWQPQPPAQLPPLPPS